MLFPAIPAVSSEWKDALGVLRESLSLEHRVNESLYQIGELAASSGDQHLADYIANEFLSEQISSIHELSEMITQLERAGASGLGLFLFDRELLDRP